jgi:uncharacterized membrane protein
MDGLGMTNGQRNARFARLGAMALAGGAVAVLLVWLLFLWVGAINRMSGQDEVHSFLTRLTTAVPAVLIIAAHLAIARQLLAASREMRERGDGAPARR